jgi:hypothetical protein
MKHRKNTYVLVSSNNETEETPKAILGVLRFFYEIDHLFIKIKKTIAKKGGASINSLRFGIFIL